MFRARSSHHVALVESLRTVRLIHLPPSRWRACLLIRPSRGPQLRRPLLSLRVPPFIKHSGGRLFSEETREESGRPLLASNAADTRVAPRSESSEAPVTNDEKCRRGSRCSAPVSPAPRHVSPLGRHLAVISREREREPAKRRPEDGDNNAPRGIRRPADGARRLLRSRAPLEREGGARFVVEYHRRPSSTVCSLKSIGLSRYLSSTRVVRLDPEITTFR